VKAFSRFDLIHLEAAKGWLGLGDHHAADAELKEIAAELRAHPDVLAVHWEILAKERKWKECLELGEALVKLAPEKPSGWLNRSIALHRLKRTHLARDELLPAARKFPKDWQVRYDLARYACLLGRLEEARAWLDEAFELGPRDKLKDMAVGDPDLKLIWDGF
jgi:tetratricopeptide (TPR) repeat protein